MIFSFRRHTADDTVILISVKKTLGAKGAGRSLEVSCSYFLSAVVRVLRLASFFGGQNVNSNHKT